MLRVNVNAAPSGNAGRGGQNQNGRRNDDRNGRQKGGGRNGSGGRASATSGNAAQMRNSAVISAVFMREATTTQNVNGGRSGGTLSVSQFRDRGALGLAKLNAEGLSVVFGAAESRQVDMLWFACTAVKYYMPADAAAPATFAAAAPAASKAKVGAAAAAAAAAQAAPEYWVMGNSQTKLVSAPAAPAAPTGSVVGLCGHVEGVDKTDHVFFWVCSPPATSAAAPAGWFRLNAAPDDGADDAASKPVLLAQLAIAAPVGLGTVAYPVFAGIVHTQSARVLPGYVQLDICRDLSRAVQANAWRDLRLYAELMQCADAGAMAFMPMDAPARRVNSDGMLARNAVCNIVAWCALALGAGHEIRASVSSVGKVRSFAALLDE